MKLLYEFDKKDYDESMSVSHRKAVRAIILKNEKIAMIKSNKEGFYKFPGGGVEKNENHSETLIRETAEEAGLTVIPDSIKEFGAINERRRSTMFPDEIFDHTSYYYFADVVDGVIEQNLDDYEKELEFVLEYVEPGYAEKINKELGEKYHSDFLLRDAKVLELLSEYLKNTVAKS